MVQRHGEASNLPSKYGQAYTRLYTFSNPWLCDSWHGSYMNRPLPMTELCTECLKPWVSSNVLYPFPPPQGFLLTDGQISTSSTAGHHGFIGCSANLPASSTTCRSVHLDQWNVPQVWMMGHYQPTTHVGPQPPAIKVIFDTYGRRPQKKTRRNGHTALELDFE
jgi:hypothetical protein